MRNVGKNEGTSGGNSFDGRGGFQKAEVAVVPTQGHASELV